MPMDSPFFTFRSPHVAYDPPGKETGDLDDKEALVVVLDD